MKNILVIAYHYPPIRASSNRTFYFTKYLPDYGFQPFVLTVDKPGYGDKSDDSIKIPDNIKVYRIRNKNTRLTRMISKYAKLAATSDFVWIKQAIKKGLEIIKENKIDLIFCSGPYQSAYIIGHKLKQETNLPLVLDFRDPWFTDKEKYGNLQRNILKSSDLIISVNEVNAKEIKNYTDKRVYIIPNGIDIDLISKYRRENKKNNFTIGCASSLFPNYRVRELIQAVHLLNTRDNINIGVDIAGAPYELLKGYVSNNNIKNINFHGYLPYGESIKLLAKADICFLGQDIPSGGAAKVFDYMALGKPTLAFVPEDSYIAKLIKEEKIGLCVQDVDKLAENIKFFITNKEELKRMSENCIIKSKKYDRVLLTERLAKLFNTLINTN